MTEEEWYSCGIEYDHQRLQAMLAFLEGKISDRKLRLFACACCRRIWGLLRDNCSRQAVEAAERFADRAAKRKQLHRALLNAEMAQSAARRRDGWPSPGDHAHSAAVAVASMQNNVLWAANRAAIDSAAAISTATHENARVVELAAQIGILLDIFGNPFQPVILDATWLTPTVVALAQAAYDERILPSGHLDPARLTILADALEDAGCTSADILHHLRGPGTHVRGCWVVDRLTGRE